jgi:hypothetical protein
MGMQARRSVACFLPIFRSNRTNMRSSSWAIWSYISNTVLSLGVLLHSMSTVESDISDIGTLWGYSPGSTEKEGLFKGRR